MGYHGNLKRLWTEMDVNKNEFITMIEIDREAGKMVGTFKLELMKKYGDMLTAWKLGVDTNGNGTIEEREIEKCLQILGLKMSPKKLFRMLVTSPGGTGVTLRDFDPEAHRRWLTEDFSGLFSKGDMEFIDDVVENKEELPEDARRRTPDNTAMKWRQLIRKAEVAETKEAVQKNYRMRIGLHSREGFKKALITRCGSLFSAWREALDLDDNGRLTFGEFTQALHRLGYHGDVQGLWDDIDRENNGVIFFSDLDPETDDAWNELRDRFCEVYGNMLKAWMQGVDVGGTGCVNKKQFVKACQKVNFEGDAERLFLLMRPEAGRRNMSLKDFDTKAYQAFARNDFRMLSEADSDGFKPSPLEMTFNERTEAGFFFQIRKAWNTSRRKEFKKACRIYDPPKQKVDTPEKFVSLCSRKYGSMVAAWSLGLDVEGQGRLNFNEFCDAARRLGYIGSLRNLWVEFVAEKKNLITLKDLDPEGDDAVTRFFAIVHQRFKELATLWSEVFKKDPYKSITVEELRDGCKELGFPDELVEKLFLCLQPVPGVGETENCETSANKLFLWDLEKVFVTTRRIWERSKPRNQRRQVMPAGTSLVVAREAFLQKAAAAHELTQTTTKMGDDETRRRGCQRYDPETRVPSVLAHGLTPQLVRQAFIRDFVTTVNAWNTELDWRGVGFVTEGQLFPLLERLGLRGNVKKLWNELVPKPDDSTRGVLRFVDLDPEAQKMLTDVRTKMLADYGTLVNAWAKGFDPGNVGHVDREDFRSVCQTILPDMKPKMVDTLFKSLKLRHGQRSLKMYNLRALLVGLATKAERAAAWDGGTNSDADAGDNILPGDEEERPVPINTLEGFKVRLIAQYGSFFSAWRYLLDKDHNGIVSQKDFCEAARKFGVLKVASVWRELDRNDAGQITLKDLDPETAEAWDEFHALLHQKAAVETARLQGEAAQSRDEALNARREAVRAKKEATQAAATTGCTASAPSSPAASPAAQASPSNRSLAASIASSVETRASVKPSLKEAWRRIFDPQKIRRIDRPRFVDGCQVLGYSKDPVRLYQLLQPDPFREYLVYEDLVIDLNPNDFAINPAVEDTDLPIKKKHEAKLLH